jgi:hypothetical protein
VTSFSSVEVDGLGKQLRVLLAHSMCMGITNCQGPPA